MINRNLLKPNQLSVLQTINERLKAKEKTTTISLIPGAGRNSILGAALEDSQTINNKSERILLVVSNQQQQRQLVEEFSEYLSVSVSSYQNNESIRGNKVIVMLLKDYLDFLQEPRADFMIALIILIDLGKLPRNIGSHYTKKFQTLFLVFEDDTQKVEETVDYDYTVKHALEDGIYVPIKYLHITLGMSGDQKSFHELFPSIESDDEQSPDITGSSQSYFNVLAMSILDIIKAKKTIIISPTISHAETLSAIINERSGSGISRAVHHKTDVKDLSEKLRKFQEFDSHLSVLVIVGMNSLIDSNPQIQYIIPLKRYTNPLHFKNIIQRSMRVSPGKSEISLIDYVGNKKSMIHAFDAEVPLVEEDILVPRRFLTESNILFRDKRNIETVLSADELAQELSEIIKIIPGEQGSMIGIFGSWGRGKTFLMDLVWKELEKSGTFIKVDFHAWKYQDTPANWAYLYEKMAGRYFDDEKKSNWFVKWAKASLRLLKLNLKRQRYKPIVKFTGIVIFSGIAAFVANALVVDKLNISNKFYEALKIPVAVTLFIYTLFSNFKKEFGATAKDIFLKYSSKHSFKDHLGLQAEIQKETLELLKCWIPDRKIGKKKIVLFVEDIDRCNETKIIQIIDSLRVLLEDAEIAERVVVVAGVDERILKLAIKNKYHDLTTLDKKDDVDQKLKLSRMTDEYMDKLFISGIKLGRLSMYERDEFILALTKTDTESETPIKTLEAIIEEEKRHQDSKMSDHFQQLLIDSDIEEQNSQQDFEESRADDYYSEDYHTEYLEPSEPVDQNKLNSEKGKLAAEEIDILRFATSKYTDATPRQIRIFYYRYLIAKNLLARRYRKLGRNNIWITISNSMIVARLIIAYTVTEEPGILEKHLNDALASNSTYLDIQLLSLVSASTTDYRELLKTLSIVIAY